MTNAAPTIDDTIFTEQNHSAYTRENHEVLSECRPPRRSPA